MNLENCHNHSILAVFNGQIVVTLFPLALEAGVDMASVLYPGCRPFCIAGTRENACVNTLAGKMDLLNFFHYTFSARMGDGVYFQFTNRE